MVHLTLTPSYLCRYFKTAGNRVFDVFVEELLVAGNFDAVQLAGPNTAVILDRVFSVTDGGVTIRLATGIENPAICGIEVLSTMASVPVPAPVPKAIRVNAGGGAYADPSGNIWEADDSHKYYNGGTGTWACPQTIANTSNPNLYCTYRWYNLAQPYLYQIPVPSGNYQVRLHFAEV